MDGVQSSSQNGSSGVAPTRTFDVSVETEVLQLLNFIRRGPFSPEEKNTYRDTVLDFATEKNTASLQVLSETLLQHGVELTSGGQPLVGSAPVATEHVTESVSDVTEATSVTEAISEISEQPPQSSVAETEEVRPMESGSTINSFGGSRPRPQFGSSVDTQQSSVVSPQTPEVKTETPDPVAIEETPIAPHDPDMDQPPVPLEPVPDLPSVGQSPSVDESVISVSTPVQKQDTSSTEPEKETTPIVSEMPTNLPVSEPAPEPTAAPAEMDSVPTPVKPPIERIKEIKRRVNDAVGNPVHLIDANNEIGREYMNALLNAMKQVSDGTGADMEHAMDRLEKAYESVMRLLIEQPLIKEQLAAENTKAAAQESVVAPETATNPPTVTEDKAENIPAEPVKVPETEITPAPESTPAPEPAAVSVESTTSPEPSVSKVPPAPSVPEAPVATSTPPVPEKVVPATPASPEVASQPKSLAAQLEEKKNAQDILTQENLSKNQANAASADPLQAPQVSSGLQQLLSEWKLFKSSGFLGTGPSGFEHPLYKQLAAMPMSSVVAGRFDGATPEVRQSISDYMNGWYYEQNVAHEMNETFEHYLRRVVSRILGKQKAAASTSAPGKA